jgi:sec-independent protein translocase protein TatA
VRRRPRAPLTSPLMPNIGPLEIAVVLIIVLIIFGPKRLPELGQSMGRGIREFRNSISGDKDKGKGSEEKPRELQASQSGATDPAKPTASAGGSEAAKHSETSAAAEPVEGEVVTENKA